MRNMLRTTAGLFLIMTAATAAQAAGDAVNTMGAPYYDAHYETFNPRGDPLDSDFVTSVESTSGSIGVQTVSGSLWNSQPALQQAVVTNDGTTYWTRASGPVLNSPPTMQTAVGGVATVTVAQSFTKTSDAAQLRFTYTGGLLQAFRDAERRPDCGPVDCMSADLLWTVTVWRNDLPDHMPPLKVEGSWASLSTENGIFRFSSGHDAIGGNPVNALWAWDCDRCDLPAQGLAEARLQAPFTGIVDLSGIPFDPRLAVQPEFTVVFSLQASAYSRVEWVGATAWARDPLDLGNDAGIGLTVLDLQPTNNPISAVPEPTSALMLALGLAGLVGWRNRRTVCAP
jgi:PEP-CTERM motif